MESDDFNRIIKDKTSSSILQKEDDNVSEKEDTYKFTDTFFTENAGGAVTSVKDIYQNIEEKKEEEEDEIPILDDLIQAYSSPSTTFPDIGNKEEKLSNYISKAYSLFGNENVDHILSLYEKVQDDISESNTKKLDEEILSICNNESEKYNQFLDIFYKIIYIKYIKQIEETNK